MHRLVRSILLYNIVSEEVFEFADKINFLRKNGYNFMCFHCIIHKEALFTKHINLLNTMEVAIRIISKVRGFRYVYLESINAKVMHELHCLTLACSVCIGFGLLGSSILRKPVQFQA